MGKDNRIRGHILCLWNLDSSSLSHQMKMSYHRFRVNGAMKLQCADNGAMMRPSLSHHCIIAIALSYHRVIVIASPIHQPKLDGAIVNYVTLFGFHICQYTALYLLLYKGLWCSGPLSLLICLYLKKGLLVCNYKLFDMLMYSLLG